MMHTLGRNDQSSGKSWIIALFEAHQRSDRDHRLDMA